MTFSNTVAAASLATLLLAPLASAQQESQTPPPPPCSQDDNFRAFDFWLGTWEVTPWAGGAVAGKNTIRSEEGGCVLTEHWTNVQGGTGQSINYYNPNTGKWRQVWVAGGYAIDIEGGLKEGAMALEGTIYYYAQKNSIPFKGTWTPQEDGSVRQHFEQFNAENKEWATWFDGRYVKTASAE